MTKPPKGDNVVLLDEKRKDREAEKRPDILKDAKPIEPGIDLRGKEIDYFTTVMSGESPEKDSLGIVMHDTFHGIVHTLGALWLTRAQWEGLKMAADRMLKAHSDLRAKRSPKPPSRP